MVHSPLSAHWLAAAWMSASPTRAPRRCTSWRASMRCRRCAPCSLFEGVVTGAADGYGRMAERPAATLLHLGLRQSHRRTVRLNRQAHQHDRRQTRRRVTIPDTYWNAYLSTAFSSHSTPRPGPRGTTLPLSGARGSVRTTPARSRYSHQDAVGERAMVLSYAPCLTDCQLDDRGVQSHTVPMI